LSGISFRHHGKNWIVRRHYLLLDDEESFVGRQIYGKRAFSLPTAPYQYFAKVEEEVLVPVKFSAEMSPA